MDVLADLIGESPQIVALREKIARLIPDHVIVLSTSRRVVAIPATSPTPACRYFYVRGSHLRSSGGPGE